MLGSEVLMGALALRAAGGIRRPSTMTMLLRRSHILLSVCFPRQGLPVPGH